MRAGKLPVETCLGPQFMIGASGEALLEISPSALMQNDTPGLLAGGRVVVEAAGIEPASASPTFQDLHA